MKKLICKIFKCPKTVTENPELEARVDELEKKLNALAKFVNEGPRYG